MSKEYWVIRNVQAVGFNIHSGSYVMGVPQPTAISGWIHNVLLKLSRSAGIEIPCAPKFVYAIEQYSGASGIALTPRGDKGTALAKKGVPSPIMDKPKGSVEISVVIEWDQQGQERLFSPEHIQMQIEKTRIMGASLFFNREGVSITCEPSLMAALRKLGQEAFVLSDASAKVDEALSVVDADGSSLGTTEAMACLLGRPKDGTYKPRYVPIVVGYKQLVNNLPADKFVIQNSIESSMDHAGVDDEQSPTHEMDISNMAQVGDEPGSEGAGLLRHETHPHFYVEPLLSVGLFQSKSAAVKSVKNNEFAGLWHVKSGAEAWMVSGRDEASAADALNQVDEFPI